MSKEESMHPEQMASQPVEGEPETSTAPEVRVSQGGRLVGVLSPHGRGADPGQSH